MLDTWLYVGPLATSLVAGLVWISFIAWGCHFHSGGGTKGATTAVACMSWGALVGMGAVMLASGPLGTALGAEVGTAIAVGLGAAVICLSSKVPLLATIPASVYGFASIAGPIILRGDAPEKAILPTVALDRHRRGVRLRFGNARQCPDQEGRRLGRSGGRSRARVSG